MKKVYIVTRLVKDEPTDDWRLLENDVPGAIEIFTKLHQADILVSTIAEDLKLCGWQEYVFHQIQDVREWHELLFGKKRIALVIFEKEIDL